MKKIALYGLLLFSTSCSEVEIVEPENVIEEELADLDVINDTVLFMELFPEDEVVEETELEVEEKPSDLPFESDWYDYLLDNFDTISVSNKVIGHSAYGGYDICLFEQSFENGIGFEYIGCGESGETQNLVFPGYTKAEIFEVINIYFHSEDNTWNEDSTEYKADGAGCYYSISVKQDTCFVSNYCGC